MTRCLYIGESGIAVPLADIGVDRGIEVDIGVDRERDVDIGVDLGVQRQT